MKKVFRINGLECANCAAKIEERVGRLDGVSQSSVSFVTTKMVIEGDEAKMNGIVEAARKIVKKLEPDAVMESA